jgi:CheY-like chemotaxis protein
MWVESEKGEGSVFYFTLPYKSHNIEKEREDEGESTDYNWEGKNLLIVEDDPTSLEYMKEILEPIGAELILKPTGEEGYSAFKDNPHLDLILMDIRLPDTSGIEIIKRIRQTNKDVRIIAQTAHALGEDRNICLQAGADDYIAKPIEISELLKIINKYI